MGGYGSRKSSRKEFTMNTLALHKNWKAICALTDTYLKIFLVLCKNADVLGKVRKGFPELFQDEESLSVFPLSLIKATAEEWKASHRGDPWNEYLEKRTGIPVLLCLHPDHELLHGSTRDDYVNSIMMPDYVVRRYDEIFSQCADGDGLPWRQVRVVINDQAYYVIWINNGGIQSEIGACHHHDDNKDFYCVPCECIDLNS